MVDTIKFSEMTNAGNINNDDIMPSLRSSVNVILNNPWTFLPSGDTASRPAPSSTINFRLRFNTEDQLYEYYDAVAMMWTQLQESAFTVGPFITYKADASLPDAQNLGLLANGILKQSITTGVATLDIAVNGTDYWAPGDALTRTQVPTVGSDVTNKTYVDTLVGTPVTSLQGTANQVLVNGTSGSPQTGVLVLTTPQNIGTASSPTFAGLTMTGDINLGSVARTINALNPTNPQDYATKFYVDQTSLNGTSVYAASAATLGTVTQSGSGVGATLTNAGVQATFAVDGATPPVGVNVLIKNTATGMTAANEGIYTVTSAGSGATNWVLTRATSYDTPVEINNTGLIVVQNGSTLAGTLWYNTATIATVDTTSFSYSQFGGIYALKGANADITSMSGLTGYLQAPLGVKDANGNVVVAYGSIASAVNYIQLFNSATGASNQVFVNAMGSDSAVPLALTTKNSNVYLQDNTATIAPALRFYNAATTHFTGLKVATAQATDLTLVLPATDLAGAMQSDGSGNLSLAKLLLTNMASQNALTLLANITGGAAAPTAITADQAITNFKFPNFKIIGSTRDLTTASGTQAFTGAGFTPRYLILLTCSSTGASPISIGIYDGSTRFAMGNFSVSSAAVTAFVSATSWVSLAAVDSANYQTAVVTSLDSDGFTLTWTKTASPTGTVNVYAICVQ